MSKNQIQIPNSPHKGWKKCFRVPPNEFLILSVVGESPDAEIHVSGAIVAFYFDSHRRAYYHLYRLIDGSGSYNIYRPIHTHLPENPSTPIISGDPPPEIAYILEDLLDDSMGELSGFIGRMIQ